jgi:hypothetical protein
MRWLQIAILQAMALFDICKHPRDGADLMELEPKVLQISASVDPADDQSALNNPKVACPSPA